MVKRNINTGRQQPPHVIIQARAGTGKTTTLIQALRGIKGMDPCMLPEGRRITPSEQQLAIWEQVELSKDARSITFVAFNRSIAAELKKRVPKGVYAKTMHGLGFGQIHKTWDLLPGDKAVSPYKVSNLIEEATGEDLKKLRKDEPDFVNATCKLVSLCKMNLAAPSEGNLAQLASKYEVDTNGSWQKVCEFVPKILTMCEDPSTHGYIDFDDMIWLPVVHNLPIWVNDLLLVDEAQDLNPCQQKLAQMAGRRIILCGDSHQAIYGFTGADTEGLERMKRKLSDTRRGCVELKLTETRRCGKNIVKENNAIVKDFTAHESNGDGLVTDRYSFNEDDTMTVDGHVATADYRKYVRQGDMVICRVNAPLVSECFKFIKSGQKANIQGRDVGQGLISLIDKYDKGANDIEILIARMEEWAEKETKKERALKNPNEQRIIGIQDRFECLLAFSDGAKDVEEMKDRIRSMFTDRSDTKGILLSSGHKAKGLESDRVWFLEPEGASCPHPMARSAWQVEQELNLRYVIQTRAICELHHVS